MLLITVTMVMELFEHWQVSYSRFQVGAELYISII